MGSVWENPVVRMLPPAIDALADRKVCREVEIAVAAGARRVVIDLALTDVVETSTLRTLIGVSRIVHKHGGDIGVVATREQARKTLSLTGLDKVFTVFHSAGEAVAFKGRAFGSETTLRQRARS